MGSFCLTQMFNINVQWGFGDQGKKGIYFRGTGEQRPNFEGNRGTMTIFENREHTKTNFRALGNRGTGQFISGEQAVAPF